MDWFLCDNGFCHERVKFHYERLFRKLLNMHDHYQSNSFYLKKSKQNNNKKSHPKKKTKCHYFEIYQSLNRTKLYCYSLNVMFDNKSYSNLGQNQRFLQ